MLTTKTIGLVRTSLSDLVRHADIGKGEGMADSLIDKPKLITGTIGVKLDLDETLLLDRCPVAPCSKSR